MWSAGSAASISSGVLVAVATDRADEPAPDFPSEDAPYEPGIGLLGHAGPYFPYDPDDDRAPKRVKRAPGFVTSDDYVKGGSVREYAHSKRRRAQKR